ncbi:DHA2 family efflux MFS transporter permease subunit [Lactiplantibacillus carotarum]|uniref:DHA2 family efflux MFS transporter permease subunit n=1 Tax=Lactiplantibacillus carotarum TaxID=2993456 RepID=UPI00298F2D95|nr:DHA2 family efflux MFS transporter permease subunit [Lactiplantibacillus carotarum]
MDNTSMNTARVQIKHPALAMLSLMIGAFVGMFSETSLNIALPSLVKALNVSQGTIQWLVTGYMLVISIVMPLSSLFSRRFSTKKLVLVALGAFIIGAIVSATGSRFGIVLLGRMLQGVGTGIILPLMFAVAMQIFPPTKIGTINGLAALVIMFAPAIGPTLTGFILAKYSWNYIFWLFIPFLVIAFILTLLFVDNVFEREQAPIDALSVIESVIGFGGIVVGASRASDAGWLSMQVIAFLIVGVIGLALYTHRQLHLDKPILNLRVFKNSAFTIGTILVMLDFGLIIASMYLLPIYLQNGMQMAVATTGLIMLPGGIVNAVVSAVSGRLYDNYGAKWLARIGFMISIIGIVILLISGISLPVGIIILGHIVLMIGAPLAMSPAQTYGLSSLAGPESADGSAILNTLEQVVGAVATAIATSLISIGTSAKSGTSGTSSGVHYGFAFVMVFAIVALLVSFKINSRQHSN